MEVHKLVVGPYDNNVFVLRCRETGESVLIDAANEHEKLLELCTRLNVRSKRMMRDFSYLSASCPAVAENRKNGRMKSPAHRFTSVPESSVVNAAA